MAEQGQIGEVIQKETAGSGKLGASGISFSHTLH